MRDLTIGLDASLTLILVGYYSILELHRKKEKLHQTFSFFSLREKKRKVQQQKEIDNFCNQ